MGLSRGSSRGHFSVGGNKAYSLDPPHGKSMEAVGGGSLSKSEGGSCPPLYRVGPSPRGIVGKGCMSPLPLFPVYPTLLRNDGVDTASSGYLLLKSKGCKRKSPLQGESVLSLSCGSHIGGDWSELESVIAIIPFPPPNLVSLRLSLDMCTRLPLDFQCSSCLSDRTTDVSHHAFLMPLWFNS